MTINSNLILSSVGLVLDEELLQCDIPLLVQWGSNAYSEKRGQYYEKCSINNTSVFRIPNEEVVDFPNRLNRFLNEHALHFFFW